MLFVDPAFVAFEIINSNWFVISEHRWGAFITQMFPLFGVKFRLPLKAILLLYSSSFYLFYLVVFLICGWGLKQYRYGILLVLYLTLLVSDVYFWPNNEIHQAVGYSMLFFGLYAWAREKRWAVGVYVHLLLIVFLGLAIISHLIVVIPLVFVWVYEHLDSRERRIKDAKCIGIYSFFIAVFLAVRYGLSKNSWYDGAKLEGIKTASISKLWSCFSNEQASTYLDLVFGTHWVVIPIFMLGLYSLLRHRKFLLVGWFIISVLGYFIVVSVTHSLPIESNNLFYYESQWTCWAIILSLPFVYEFLGRLTARWVIVVLFVFIFLSRLPCLNQALHKFQVRLELLETISRSAIAEDDYKLLVNVPEQIEENLLMTWGLPVETMLLTSLEGKQTMTTVKLVDEKFIPTLAKDSIYTAFKLLSVKDLNADYFTVDTNKPYVRGDWVRGVIIEK